MKIGNLVHEILLLLDLNTGLLNNKAKTDYPRVKFRVYEACLLVDLEHGKETSESILSINQFGSIYPKLQTEML